MKVRYSSNNSGGSWWLSDDDWIALERAGWSVSWGAGVIHHDLASAEEAKKYRSLDALATGATLECASAAEAIRSFEKITGKDSSEEGCNCCGPPHSFNWEEDGKRCDASGADILDVILPSGPRSLREARERFNPNNRAPTASAPAPSRLEE